MKRLVLAAVAAASIIGFAAAAQAGGKRNDWVCWTGRNGGTDCADLPEPYRVPDTPVKPHRHNDWASCRHCAKGFTLSHDNIDGFAKYTSTQNMRPYHGASLYGWKNRGIRD